MHNMSEKYTWLALRKWAIAMYTERKREIKHKIDKQIQENESIKGQIEEEHNKYELEMHSLQEEITRLECRDGGTIPEIFKN
jgi:predicted nuclease with TOPRIM domain